MRTVLNTLVVLMLFVLFITDSKKLFDSFTEPTIYIEAHAEKQVVVGGELRLIYHIVRVRICPLQLSRFIIRDGDVLWRDKIVGGASGKGEHVVSNTVKLPPEIPPGEYVFRTFAFAMCSDGTHAMQVPDIKFTVVQ